MINPAIGAAISDLQSALASFGTLQGASQQALAPIISQINATLSLVDAQSNQLESQIDQTSLGGVIAGQPVPVMIANLTSQTQIVSDLAQLKNLRGYLGRIAFNLSNAPG